jgi:hypothetical protein
MIPPWELKSHRCIRVLPCTDLVTIRPACTAQGTRVGTLKTRHLVCCFSTMGLESSVL